LRGHGRWGIVDGECCAQTIRKFQHFRFSAFKIFPLTIGAGGFTPRGACRWTTDNNRAERTEAQRRWPHKLVSEYSAANGLKRSDSPEGGRPAGRINH
jgi:hypothetical protein